MLRFSILSPWGLVCRLRLPLSLARSSTLIDGARHHSFWKQPALLHDQESTAASLAASVLLLSILVYLGRVPWKAMWNVRCAYHDYAAFTCPGCTQVIPDS